MMRVITRRENEGVLIGTDVEITVLEIVGDRVRLGIAAPGRIPAYWEETLEWSNDLRDAEHSDTQLVVH